MSKHTLLLLCALTACTEAVAPEEGPLLPERFLALGVGSEHSCAITPESEVFCWGANTHGQLGDSVGTSSTIPVLVRSPVPLVQVSGGTQHTCALDPGGDVYCWGGNERGQLGTGDRSARVQPTRIASTERFAQVSAGAFHSCALTSDRRIYCWGAGDHGGTGAEETADVLTPREIDTPIRFIAVSAGGTHTCAIDTGNIGHCWGKNDRGQLGDASLFDRREPGRPVHGAARFREIEAGVEHTCAIATDNRPYCWGSNFFGELGEGAPPTSGAGAVTPYPVRLSSSAHISAGAYASCLTDNAANAWCWGRGNEGQLGNGSRFDYIVPIRVNAADLGGTLRFRAIGVGLHHACALTTIDTIYCWGRGDRGQLGAGSLLYSTLPVRVRDRSSS